MSLAATDVIHAFYVPKFLFKRDVVPGKENIFDFTVDEPGTYRGQCAELCGAFHGSMIFEVHALPKADFDAWLSDADREGERDADAGRRPARPRGPTVELAGEERRVHHERPPGARPTRPSRSTSRTTTPASRTTSRSRTRPAPRCSRASSSTASGETTYAVPALAAGTYPFVCTVHPNMTGTLTVQ